MIINLILFLKKYKIHSSSQYGFWSGKSTSLAVMEFVHLVYEKLDTGETVITSYFFSKSFDCPDHFILISKLFQYGVRRTPLERFKSHLSERKQYVSIDFSRFYKNFHYFIVYIKGPFVGPCSFWFILMIFRIRIRYSNLIYLLMTVQPPANFLISTKISFKTS